MRSGLTAFPHRPRPGPPAAGRTLMAVIKRSTWPPGPTTARDGQPNTPTPTLIPLHAARGLETDGSFRKPLSSARPSGTATTQSSTASALPLPKNRRGAACASRLRGLSLERGRGWSFRT
ncbi:hypothetical protein SKAU_G00429720 [Synaphobranchus kaupii]|uniref:Uncharacterized protein n=1 Tax=Synaphobranchus kaupii TaxID=118154 RepID=A0A9Q1E4E0_SYNKA|nr:hypothetical protein SKAU_G00429720 [Synaphobranchus kaupii]